MNIVKLSVFKRRALVWGAFMYLFSWGPVELFSQTDTTHMEIPSDTIESLSPLVNTDTLLLSQGEEMVLKKEIKPHSPHKATLYSAILPGMGQAYNRKYWKIPIVYAGLGGVIYGLSFNHKYYIKYKNAYRDFIIRDPANTSYVQFALKAGLNQELVETTYASWFERALKNKKDYYRRNRDLSIIGLVGVYVLNIIDATVDAHFFNYDISNDLTLQVQPELYSPITHPDRGNGGGIQINLRF